MADRDELLDFARRYAAAWSSQDPAGVAEHYSPEGSLTINDGPPSVGREAVKEAALSFMTALPDIQVLMDDLVVIEGGIQFHWTFTGTNTGPGGTGNQVRVSGFEEWTIGEDGLIVESLGHFDQAEYERQLEQGLGDADASRAPSRMRTYDPPPSGFDPHTAPSRLLRLHGLPERPDPERAPAAARLWQLAFPGPTTFVKAELAVQPSFSHPRRPRTGESAFGADNWSGAVVQTGSLGFPGETAQWVYAQWVVPYVLLVDPVDEDLTIGFWVGLDGYLNKQVLQAGIRADVSKGWLGTGFFADVTYRAWTEWINQAHANEPQDAAATVENFPVEPGDTVSVLVCAPQPDLGHIVIGNLTKGLMTSISVPADPGITLDGSSAEWIVEGVSAALPYFYPLTFMNCTACTQSHFFDLTHGGPIDRLGTPAGAAPYGSPLTHTTIVSPSTAVVEWKYWY